MDSFYSGRAGSSFALRASFPSYSSMVEAFRTGSAYEDCWYGEYCLIDTVNKNDKDNGKLYKRGVNYTADNGDAQYVGQIVGPATGLPFMQFEPLSVTKERSKDALASGVTRHYPVGKDSDGRQTINQSDEDIAVMSFSDGTEGGLVPGKTADGTFNDEMKWTWVSVREPSQESESWYYLGFEVPYLVTECQTHNVSPYDTVGNLLDNATTIERVDDRSHPYYNKWDLGIPKGIKGDAFRNLRVMVPIATDKLYLPSAVSIDSTGKATIGAEGYPAKADDVAAKRQILVYDYFIFDGTQNPAAVTFYLGPFNQVDEMSLAEDGTLTIGYTHDDNTVFSRKIQWINSATLAPDSGVFTVTYNNGTPAFTTTLDWINDIILDDDGTLHFLHTKDKADDIYAQKLRWIKSVDLNVKSGLFTVTFNNGDPVTRQLDWIDGMTIDEASGKISVHHIDVSKGVAGTETLDARLKLVTSAAADATGAITFGTNVGENIKLLASGTNDQYHLKMVNDLILTPGLTGDKRLQVKYNTSSETTAIGDPINFISDMVVRESDFHLLVLFNDPSHRPLPSELTVDGYDAQGNKWVQQVTGTNGTTTAVGIYWRDFGAVKDQSGVLVGRRITDDNLLGALPIDWLNEHYPLGLTEGNMKQKIVIYSPDNGGTSEFYAYDYSKTTDAWFFVGSLADSGMRDVVVVTQGEFLPADLSALQVNGVVIKIVPDKILQDAAIPSYWDKAYNSWG